MRLPTAMIAILLITIYQLYCKKDAAFSNQAEANPNSDAKRLLENFKQQASKGGRLSAQAQRDLNEIEDMMSNLENTAKSLKQRKV